MAPEQWKGAPEDERTDVFALGVLVHRALTGELPFKDDGGRSLESSREAPTLEIPELPALGVSTLDVDYFGPTPPPGKRGFCGARGAFGTAFPIWLKVVKGAVPFEDFKSALDGALNQ